MEVPRGPETFIIAVFCLVDETLAAATAGRYDARRVRARDLWHLSGRLLREVLSHTVAVLLNHGLGNPPLQLARLPA